MSIADRCILTNNAFFTEAKETFYLPDLATGKPSAADRKAYVAAAKKASRDIHRALAGLTNERLKGVLEPLAAYYDSRAGGDLDPNRPIPSGSLHDTCVALAPQLAKDPNFPVEMRF